MYIHFTEEQKQQARQTDIVSFLQSQGEQIKKSGSEYEWFYDSQKITIRDNLWFHQYERVGGDVIDFVRKFYNKSFQDAMEYLLGNSSCTLTHMKQEKRTNQIKEFIPPSKSDDMSRVLKYLNIKRGIDKEIIYSFAHDQMLYESKEYHSAVFLGFDKNGVSRHAHMRGIGASSTYKGVVVFLNTVFIGTEKVNICSCLKHQLICYLLSQCIKKIGRNIVMRHLVLYRTRCFFNVLKTILTSNSSICALIMTVQDKKLTSEYKEN